MKAEEKMETKIPETEEKVTTAPISDEEDKKERKTKKAGEEKVGIAHVYSSSNNTIVHITDMAGNTLSRISGGQVTKHSRLKANPTIAMFVAKRAAERPRDLGITSLYIRLKGKTTVGNTGPGAHSAVKALGKEGFKIINVLDSTKYPRGGPKKKGGRRGRRV